MKSLCEKSIEIRECGKHKGHKSHEQFIPGVGIKVVYNFIEKFHFYYPLSDSIIPRLSLKCNKKLLNNRRAGGDKCTYYARKKNLKTIERSITWQKPT